MAGTGWLSVGKQGHLEAAPFDVCDERACGRSEGEARSNYKCGRQAEGRLMVPVEVSVVFGVHSTEDLRVWPTRCRSAHEQAPKLSSATCRRTYPSPQSKETCSRGIAWPI